MFYELIKNPTGGPPTLIIQRESDRQTEAYSDRKTEIERKRN